MHLNKTTNHSKYLYTLTILLLFMVSYVQVFAVGILNSEDESSENEALIPPRSVHAEELSYNSVKISWTECKDVDGYRIYRYDDSSSKFSPIKTINSKRITSYVDNEVSADTGYAYKIKSLRKNKSNFLDSNKKSVDKFSISKSSEMTSATPILEPTKILSIRSLSNGKITIYWQEQENVSGYELYRSTKNDGAYEKIFTADSPDKVTFTDNKVKKNKTYYYRIESYLYEGDKKITSDLSGLVSEESEGKNILALEKRIQEKLREEQEEFQEELEKNQKNTIEGYEIISSFQVKSYAYSGGGVTATGQKCQVGRIAVDPTVIPLGTWLYVEGYGLCQACDTGGDIIGKTIDVYMNTELECKIWGIKYPTVYILKI